MEQNLTETTKRFALRSLRRRWWVIPLAVLATAIAGYAAASLKAETYTASSWVISTSDTGTRGPGQAFDASRLALSYATSLSEDDQLIAYIAKSINKSPNEVDDNFSTLNQTDTAVLRLRYRDKDPTVATRGARAAAEGAVGSRPIASSITPGTLSLVKLADEPERSTDIAALGGVVGALLGLGLGIILMLAWERADPRVDEPADVQALIHIPTTKLDDLTSSRAAALLERWLVLADGPGARVAVVPSAKTQSIADQVAGWLYGLHVDGPELEGSRPRSATPGTSNGHGPAGREPAPAPQGAPPAPGDEPQPEGERPEPDHPTSEFDRVEHFHRPDSREHPSRSGQRGTRWRSRWYRPAPTPLGPGGPSTVAASDPGETEPAGEPLSNGADETPAVASAERQAPAHQAEPVTAVAATPVRQDAPQHERVTLVAGGPADSSSAPEVEALRSDLIVLLVDSGAPSRDVLELTDTLEQFGRRPAWVLMIGSRRKLGRRMDQAQASGVSLRTHNRASAAAKRN